jgi:hypothetical protein
LTRLNNMRVVVAEINDLKERIRELEEENQCLKGEVVAARESNPATPLCCYCQDNVAVRALAGCEHRVCCTDAECVAKSGAVASFAIH